MLHTVFRKDGTEKIKCYFDLTRSNKGFHDSILSNSKYKRVTTLVNLEEIEFKHKQIKEGLASNTYRFICYYSQAIKQ